MTLTPRLVAYPDTLKEGDIITNTVSIIVLTGRRNPSGSQLEAEVYSRKDGAFKGLRSYGTDALFSKVGSGWTLYRPEDVPTPTAPLMVLECNACDGSGWLEDATTGFRCPVCRGSAGFYACSGCGQIPSVNSAGLEQCGCSAVPVDLHPEVAYGMAQGWLTAESAA